MKMQEQSQKRTKEQSQKRSYKTIVVPSLVKESET